LRAIKDEIGRLCAMMKGGAKKVLALDFDNTLWQGVIGEDGAVGVQPFESFQREIKTLKERGVLLVALTKNNESDVGVIWDDPRMILKREDFVDLRINWCNKADNLEASAKTLNLGTDSYVFIDDNPAEREQMKSMRPEVIVPDWPVNMRRIGRLYFPELRLTAEDRTKTAQYRAEAQRRRLQDQAVDIDAYLQGLDLWAEIHPAREAELPRVAQLSQKTNQFNVCTNRYTIEDVASFAEDANRVLLTIHAGDKFGDQGLVAFVQAVINGSEAELIDWVMSCRVMNRLMEHAVEDALEHVLAEKGVTRIGACWKKTLKNAPVAELFDRFGFDRIVEREDSRMYVLVLPRSEKLKYYVKVKG